MTAVGRTPIHSEPLSGPRGLRVVEMAQGQKGVVLHEQLLTLGLSESSIRTWVARGRLIRVFPRVYALGHSVLTEAGWFLAAVLACGAGSVLSHRSASVHWGLLASRGRLLDVTTPRRSQDGLAGVRLHRPRSLSDLDHVVRDGVPVTTVARTLIDLAFYEPEWVVEKAWDQAEINRLLRPAKVAAAIERAGPRRGVRKVKRLLLLKPPPTSGTARSRLEIRFRHMLAATGLPEPEINVLVSGYEVDFFWRDEGVIVETDGGPFHSTSLRQRRDAIRDRIHREAGYVVLRFPDTDIDERPQSVLNEVRSALNSRRGPESDS